MHTKPLGHWLAPEKKIFKGFLPYLSVADMNLKAMQANKLMDTQEKQIIEHSPPKALDKSSMTQNDITEQYCNKVRKNKGTINSKTVALPHSTLPYPTFCYFTLPS